MTLNKYAEALGKETRFFDLVKEQLPALMYQVWGLEAITVARSRNRKEGAGITGYANVKGINKRLSIVVCANKNPADEKYRFIAELYDPLNKKGIHIREVIDIKLSGSATGKIAEARGIILDVLRMVKESMKDTTKSHNQGFLKKMFG